MVTTAASAQSAAPLTPKSTWVVQKKNNSNCTGRQAGRHPPTVQTDRVTMKENTIIIIVIVIVTIVIIAIVTIGKINVVRKLSARRWNPAGGLPTAAFAPSHDGGAHVPPPAQRLTGGRLADKESQQPRSRGRCIDP
eukprot:GHVU01138262.1.p3 GENE.GHVU01138262.1~~GHVU01138262.1.p3  ORF type:complete len:137 (-),score=20.47 GHVU01138262.1:137-547(-)